MVCTCTQEPAVPCSVPSAGCVWVCVVHCALGLVVSPARAFVHCGRQVAEVWWVCYPSPTKTNIHAGPHKYCPLIQSSTYQGQALNSTHSEAQGWIDPHDSGLGVIHVPDVLWLTNMSTTRSHLVLPMSFAFSSQISWTPLCSCRPFQQKKITQPISSTSAVFQPCISHPHLNQIIQDRISRRYFTL